MGASLVAQLGKNPPAMWETWVQSLGWEDSPGERKGYPLQYSGLENSTDCTVHGVAESDMTGWLSISLSPWGAMGFHGFSAEDSHGQSCFLGRSIGRGRELKRARLKARRSAGRLRQEWGWDGREGVRDAEGRQPRGSRASDGWKGRTAREWEAKEPERSGVTGRVLERLEGWRHSRRRKPVSAWSKVSPSPAALTHTYTHARAHAPLSSPLIYTHFCYISFRSTAW